MTGRRRHGRRVRNRRSGGRGGSLHGPCTVSEVFPTRNKNGRRVADQSGEERQGRDGGKDTEGLWKTRKGKRKGTLYLV